MPELIFLQSRVSVAPIEREMSWPGSSKPSPADDAKDKGKTAMPPACPRCELTKSQVRDL